MTETPQPIRGILLDIEGTTSSISFVYDEMFPFVRRKIREFLDENWSVHEFRECLALLATDLGHPSVHTWLGDKEETEQKQLVRDGVIGLMDADVKATGLKQLQGMIWKDGFESGELVAHIYDDVAPAIHRLASTGNRRADLFLGQYRGATSCFSDTASRETCCRCSKVTTTRRRDRSRNRPATKKLWPTSEFRLERFCLSVTLPKNSMPPKQPACKFC